jgi:hypothetical protein
MFHELSSSRLKFSWAEFDLSTACSNSTRLQPYSQWCRWMYVHMQGQIQGRRQPTPGHPLSSLKNKCRMVKNKISFDPNNLFIWTDHPLSIVSGSAPVHMAVVMCAHDRDCGCMCTWPRVHIVKVEPYYKICYKCWKLIIKFRANN